MHSSVWDYTYNLDWDGWSDGQGLCSNYIIQNTSSPQTYFPFQFVSKKSPIYILFSLFFQIFSFVSKTYCCYFVSYKNDVLTFYANSLLGMLALLIFNFVDKFSFARII